jgi:hypothetical protein
MSTLYLIGDEYRVETSEKAPVRTGPAGWSHQLRPGLRFIAGEDGFLVPVYFNNDAVLRIADEKLIQDLDATQAKIDAAKKALADLHREREQLLRDSADRCALVPVPG